MSPPRWMGVDLLTKNQISRWALKSENLKEDSKSLKKYNQHIGEIQKGTRNSADGALLQWKLIMPLPAPEVEIAPFALDWSMTEKHPTEIIPNMGCELIDIYANHPKPEQFKTLFNDLGYSLSIRKATTISIKVKLKTPNGIVLL